MNLLRKILDVFDLHASGKWIALAFIVGIVAGLGAILFDFMGQGVVRFTLSEFTGYAPKEAAGEHARFKHPDQEFMAWLIPIVMMVGGLISGVLVYTLAPEAEGHGTDAAIDAFHRKRGVIRGRIPVVKTIASAITLGTGGSGGREGPIAQIGAGFGSWLATRANLSPRDRRIMLAAGMGAGIGAIFRAPLAGAVFAGEIMYSDSDLEADVIVPAATSSIVAYSIYTMTLPAETRFQPLFGSNLHHTFDSLLGLFPYVALALILALIGAAYVKLFYGTRDLFKRLPGPPHIRPAIGALAAGLVGIAIFYAVNSDQRSLGVLGTGYGTLQLALNAASELGIELLLVIAIGKIITTSFTIGSGGSGGVFGPSMVIGGSVGAATGLIFHAYWPEVVAEPEAFAVVGMAGFFAGIARAPISTIIMVRALTGDFGLLVPTMLVTSLTFLFCRRWRLYEKQVPTRMDSAAHRGDFIIDVLEGLVVSDVYKPGQSIMQIQEETTLEEIVHRLAETHQHYFPVLDSEGRMVGIFSDEDVRAYLYDESIWKLANASDVMVTDVITVKPTDDLNTALKRFTALNLDELPVVDSEADAHFIGMLRRKEVISAYNTRLMELKDSSSE